MAARIAELEAENALLRRKIDALARRIFGKSSEQLDPAQLLLVLEGLDEKKPEASSGDGTSDPEEGDAKKGGAKKSKAKNHSRIKGLDTLEIVEETQFPAQYEANPDDFEIIGQEVSEQLDFVPARFFRKITRRVKVRRKGQPNLPPLLAPAPTTPLVGGLPSFNLITELIIGKYADHLPLYRQQGIFQRGGIHPPRDMLNHWTLGGLELLLPVAAAIRREVLCSDYLQCDETPLRLLAPGTGKTATSYFWVLNNPGGGIFFHWSPSRAASNLHDILGPGYCGTLQCDGFSAYPSYQKSSIKTIELGSCLTHIRRRFHAAFEAKERHAAHIMRLMGHLYHLEEKLRQQRAGPALRQAVRAAQARPILTRLRKILTILKPRHLPKSLMGDAIRYALGQWSGLDAYLADGRVEIDNNLIENGIRPTKLGQKNWLFLGSGRGGELAAVAFTLIENCKRHGLNLREYLASTMRAIVEQGPAAAPLLTPQALTTHPAKAANQSAA